MLYLVALLRLRTGRAHLHEHEALHKLLAAVGLALEDLPLEELALVHSSGAAVVCVVVLHGDGSVVVTVVYVGADVVFVDVVPIALSFVAATKHGGGVPALSLYKSLL